MPTETVLLQGKDLGLVSKLGLTKNGGHQSYKLEIRSEYIYIYKYKYIEVIGDWNPSFLRNHFDRLSAGVSVV